MNTPSMEELTRRLEAVEHELASLKQPANDWRKTYGMFDDSEFMRKLDAEVLAMREAEREAAREDRTP